MNKHMSQRVIKQVIALAFGLLFIFVLFHYSFAQEEVLETTTEVIVEENSSEIELQETPQTEEVSTVEQMEEDKTIVESIIDFFSPGEQELQDIQQEVDVVEDIEEETVQEFPIYVPPSNLPKISAFPESKEFNTDVEASHSCWVRDFGVDMTFLPNKNNIIFIQNPSQGISTMEITGVPEGFDVVFQKNNSETITLLAGQKEVPITIEKNDKPQNGNFNIVFVFTRKIGKDSITTCQMNLINE